VVDSGFSNGWAKVERLRPRIEEPKAPRGQGVRSGCFLPLGRGMGRGQ